jgi:NADPH2:quinone reductase
MMRAVRIRGTGPSSVMEVVSLAVPSFKSNEILVKTSYAGVNYIDTYQRSGVYQMQGGNNILGLEGVGEVVDAGEAVVSLGQVRVGSRVAWPMAIKSYAEYVVIPADKVVIVPDTVDDKTACAAMLQGFTAHYLVKSSFVVKENDWALVHAASGGVGLILTQMIKNVGGRVIGTCSTEEKAAQARAAGADHVIVGYDGFTTEVRNLTNGAGVSVVYDGVGKDTFTSSLDSLRPRGMMVLYGGASGQVPPFDLQGLNSRGSLSITRPSLKDFIATPEELQYRASEVFQDVANGKLNFAIGGVYDIENVITAHDDLEGRKTTGKLLLQI